MSSAQPQTNGVTAASTSFSQPAPNSLSTAAAAPSAAPQPASPSEPRPRDARLVELLLTSQGVSAYEQRVPLLLLDFAYRHTSSILNDALHLAADPYVAQAGSKPSASSGATATAPGEAAITANAVKLAISARLSYQFRGGSAGGGISKEFMQELARDRNKVSLPKIAPNEWGVRLPSERFVLSGVSWGLKDMWEEEDDDDDDDIDIQDSNGGNAEGAATGDQNSEGRNNIKKEDSGDAMEGVQGPEESEDGAEGVEGGTVEDVFGDDVDEEMAEDD